MGELKECGVHSVEQLAERHIHSLATQRVYILPSPLQYNLLLAWKGERQQEEGSFERSLVV